MGKHSEEKRAELRVRRVAVEKSVPGLWAREGAGFQCGEEEAGAGIPKEEPRASPRVQVGGPGASAAGRDEGWAHRREKAEEGCRGEELGSEEPTAAGADTRTGGDKQGL